VRRTARVSLLPVQLRAQVVSLRKTAMNVNDICDRLGIVKSSERNAVSLICAEPGLRVFGYGIEVGGPIRRGPNRAAVHRP